MLLPLYLGVLHAVEPDHVAVVAGVSLSGNRRGAWKVGLAFGVSQAPRTSSPSRLVRRRLASMPFPPSARLAPKRPDGGHASHTFHHAAAWMGAFFALDAPHAFTRGALGLRLLPLAELRLLLHRTPVPAKVVTGGGFR